MVFVKVSALLSLLAAVSAAPAPRTRAYGFLALRSASPIHFGNMNASGGKIWIGKDTTSYCPLPPQNCPAGKVTAFWVNDTAALAVSVPGGQQLYIDPRGALSYTQAHSASVPPGSIVGGFNIEDSPDGNISYLHNTNGVFVACPADKNDNGPFQVFVDTGALMDKDVPAKRRKDCLEFTAAGGAAQDAVTAWQYS